MKLECSTLRISLRTDEVGTRTVDPSERWISFKLFNYHIFNNPQGVSRVI